MRQKSKTCNRRYPFPRTYCQASSYIDGDARAALRETQDLECAEGHSVLRHSFVVSTPARLGPFVLRYSSTRDRYHPSSYFEINRDHHLRPLVGDNRR